LQVTNQHSKKTTTRTFKTNDILLGKQSHIIIAQRW